MRLSRMALVATAAAVLSLAACSSDDSSSEESASNPAADASASGAYPATVETAFGDVEIDDAPERVVALGWGDAEVALSLGVQPVGASDWLEFGGDGVGPWAEGRYDESPEIIATLEPSYEAIAALEPDLILDVHSSGDQERYDRLSSIATTVGIPVGGESYLTTMEEQVQIISAALGVPEKGDELLAEVDEAFSSVVEAHPEWEGKTVTAAAKTSEGWGAYIEGGSRLDMLARFGFVQSPTIAALPVDDGGFSVEISDEQLSLLESDLLVAFPIYLDTTEITDDPLWQRLDAVEEGRSVVIDGELAEAFSVGTPLGTIYAAQQLTPLFEEAIPAT